MAKRGILSALSGGMRQNSVYASRDFCCPGGTKTLDRSANMPHGDGIAAVVESQAGVKLDEISLLRSLEKKLEHYAIPGRILEIARMPRNENDKVDRKAVAAWLEFQLQSD